MHIKLGFIKAYMKMSVSDRKSITLGTMALRRKCDRIVTPKAELPFFVATF